MMRHPQWWLPSPLRRYALADIVHSVGDVPINLPSRAAVVVLDGDRLKWIAFDCPCTRGHRILVSLDEEVRPHWTVTRAQPLTLHPSIDAKTDGRQCHYLIRRGRIVWVPARKKR